ncbi:MAG: hypothetical protein EOM23_06285, partial [Candidatus Moranbacteria bacterium]|nr:hypothetical protein [Candidatus Moranbacteria bacterium]
MNDPAFAMLLLLAIVARFFIFYFQLILGLVLVGCLASSIFAISTIAENRIDKGKGLFIILLFLDLAILTELSALAFIKESHRFLGIMVLLIGLIGFFQILYLAMGFGVRTSKIKPLENNNNLNTAIEILGNIAIFSLIVTLLPYGLLFFQVKAILSIFILYDLLCIILLIVSMHATLNGKTGKALTIMLFLLSFG